jgi:hypothetical protein
MSVVCSPGTLQFGFQTLISVLMLTYWLTANVKSVIHDSVGGMMPYQVRSPP